jgi:hypothetical protein
VANTLLTIDQITRECLRVAHEKASFLGTINRQYDDSFAVAGAKIGSSLRIREPAKYVRRTGSRVMDVQNAVETSQTVTVATQDGVDMKFNSSELALSLDEFSDRHIVPAMSVLISGIESDVLQGCTKLTYNLAGTAGTPPADLAAVGAARAKLNQYLAPKDGNRCIQMDSVTMGTLVNGLKGLFQDSAQIKEQYREGLIGRTAMADFYENERVYTHTNGADVAGEVNMAAGVVEGATTVTVDGFTAAPAVGSVFTFELSKAVHPETKVSYSHLQQFTVTAATTTLITFSPAIYASGVNKNVSVLPLDNDDVVFVGNLSTSYVHNLMYHKDAFTFVTADLPLMADASKCVRKTFDGLSIRLWQASDIRNDELLTRLDILYGYKALRPEWACRITS